MPITFGDEERFICSLFTKGASFTYRSHRYTVTNSGKPTCSSGEPKTDVYVAAVDEARRLAEFKISFKQQNANFLENKTNADRAEQLFGANWKTIISQATSRLSHEFCSRPLIYLEDYRRTSAGSITLGWKFELLNVDSGQLSGIIPLTKAQLIDVYAGTNTSSDKRNARVNGSVIVNSGVANFILFENSVIRSIQDAANALLTVEEYVEKYPNVYFACKALNYRSFEEKYDGNRPLAVYVDWKVINGKLKGELCFSEPLQRGGDYAYTKLIAALRALSARTTNDLCTDNVSDSVVVQGRLRRGTNTTELSTSSPGTKEKLTDNPVPRTSERKTSTDHSSVSMSPITQTKRALVEERASQKKTSAPISPMQGQNQTQPGLLSKLFGKNPKGVTSNYGISVGSKVRTDKYGIGTVMAIKGDKVQVLFAGEKQPRDFDMNIAFGRGFLKKI